MARTRRATGTAERAVSGRAMVDHRTKRLVTRLRPGDIAVIDHEDIDRIAAESLVEARPSAVLNVARSSSGRYANVGPLLLIKAGIVLIDDLGPAVLEEVSEGDSVTVEGYKVIDGDRFIASGIRRAVVASIARVSGSVMTSIPRNRPRPLMLPMIGWTAASSASRSVR